MPTKTSATKAASAALLIVAAIFGAMASFLAPAASAATATYCGKTIIGAIEDKYRSLAPAGGDPTKGRLGCPTSEELTASQDSTVKYVNFANGSIYYSPAGGVHPIYSQLQGVWNSRNAMNGVFKQPVGDETPSPIGIGVYQRFKGGTIYYNSANGFVCTVDTTLLPAGSPERRFGDEAGSARCGSSWAYVQALIVGGRYTYWNRADIKFCLEGTSGCGLATTGLYNVTINSTYVRNKPDDWGMLTHELTHVAQAYFGVNDGWTAETIADYTRFAIGQPITPGKPATCDPGDRYSTIKSQCGVNLINFIDGKVNGPWVQDLNVYLHNTGSKSNVESFVLQTTGRSLQQQWDDCRAPGNPCAGGRA